MGERMKRQAAEYLVGLFILGRQVRARSEQLLTIEAATIAVNEALLSLLFTIQGTERWRRQFAEDWHQQYDGSTGRNFDEDASSLARADASSG